MVHCGHYGIYIYGMDHPPPHCHIRFSDGTELVVELPTLEPMYGGSISKDLKKVLIQNFETILDAWDELNPDRN